MNELLRPCNIRRSLFDWRIGGSNETNWLNSPDSVCIILYIRTHVIYIMYYIHATRITVHGLHPHPHPHPPPTHSDIRRQYHSEPSFLTHSNAPLLNFLPTPRHRYLCLHRTPFKMGPIYFYHTKNHLPPPSHTLRDPLSRWFFFFFLTWPTPRVIR